MVTIDPYPLQPNFAETVVFGLIGVWHDDKTEISIFPTLGKLYSLLSLYRNLDRSGSFTVLERSECAILNGSVLPPAPPQIRIFFFLSSFLKLFLGKKKPHEV